MAMEEEGSTLHRMSSLLLPTCKRWRCAPEDRPPLPVRPACEEGGRPPARSREGDLLCAPEGIARAASASKSEAMGSVTHVA